MIARCWTGRSPCSVAELCSSGSTAPINGIVGALRQSRRFSHFPAALLFEFYDLRTSSGSLAMLAAIRRASSLVSILAAERLAGLAHSNAIR